jgi:UDP-N-acetylmuramoyl-tripeptide--D-alanyl-D-alanine ligase
MKTTFKKILTHILRIESKLVLWKYKPKIIAITGSVGKTSTKDAVYAVVSNFAHVRKSEKSYNSEIGLPLTILGCSNGWNNPMAWLKNIIKGFWLFIWPHKYPKWLVLEVGVGKPGDMKKTALWLRTDVVIITAIGETPVHIEFFNSRKHLVEEKMELIKTLKKSGFLILNADDETVLEMGNKYKSSVITYGFKADADIVGSSVNISYTTSGEPQGIVFRVDENGNSLPIVMKKVFGKNHVYAALGALAVASSLKFNMVKSIDALKNYEIPPGRMCLLKGINNTLVIDDTYNSSPSACVSALETIAEVRSMNTSLGRKIAVLGDMLELGKHTEEAHKNVGRLAKETVDVLIVVGQRARDIKIGALENGMREENIFEFSNSQEAGVFLKDFIKEGDLVFIKGSQGVRMERTVASILKDQKNKKKLLVRQDREWLNKE